MHTRNPEDLIEYARTLPAGSAARTNALLEVIRRRASRARCG